MKQTQSSPDERILLSLGLARRAGQLVTGTDMVCDALGAGKVRLVVRAGDVSANTRKKLTDKCGFYRVPLLGLTADGVSLARAVGKTGTVAAAGVTGEIANSVRAAWEREYPSSGASQDESQPEAAVKAALPATALPGKNRPGKRKRKK